MFELLNLLCINLGVAISSDNILYFADGTNIRMIDKDGLVSTLIGNHMHKSHWKPIPCEGTLNTGEVHLRWPTDLSINPLDNTLHIIDDHMVLKLTTDNRLKVIAGRPMHCPPIGRISLNTDQELAIQTALVMPQSISFAPNGNMYVAESDSQRTNRIRVISKCSQNIRIIKYNQYLITSIYTFRHVKITT